MQPEDLRLQLVAVVADSKGTVYQMQAYNETISVVEAPTSFFDPQMCVSPFLPVSLIIFVREEPPN